MRDLDAVDFMMTTLVVLWGTAFVALDVLSASMDPFEITWFRYLPFIVLFGGWLVLRQRQTFRRVTGPDWIRFAVAGGLGVMGYHIPLNWALSDVTPGDPIGPPTAAILVATTPLWTLLFAVVLRQERFSPAKAIGAAVAFVGVILVVLFGTRQEADVDVVAKAWIAVLAPILWGMYSIVAKPLIHRYGGLFVTGLTMSIGTMAFLPYAIQRGWAPLAELDALGWFWMVYLSVVATVIGYTIWNTALTRRSASEVTAYIFAVPVVATAASMLLVGQRVTLWFLVGGALVLGGLSLIHRARLAATNS